MRLRTIWTAPKIALSERLSRTSDWFALEVATRLPRRVRYWVTLGEIGKATRNSKDIPATPLDEILKHMEKSHRRA